MAIAVEDYEEASRLRDQLKRVKESGATESTRSHPCQSSE
jgi:hypothetical protein